MYDVDGQSVVEEVKERVTNKNGAPKLFHSKVYKESITRPLTEAVMSEPLATAVELPLHSKIVYMVKWSKILTFQINEIKI